MPSERTIRKARARYTPTRNREATQDQWDAVHGITEQIVQLGATIDDAAPDTLGKDLALIALEDVQLRAIHAILAP